MFEVPIIHYKIGDWRNNKKKILDALPRLNETMLESNGEVYTDFFLNYEGDNLPPYADTIIDIIKPYLADFTDQRRVEFTDMWFQSAFKGQKHGVHNHGHSGWSSVIYVEFNPKIHTSTHFYSPFLNPWSGRLQTFTPPVEEGDMIIFPATISHEALPNESDTKRTIISYNLRGKIDVVKKTLWQGDPIIRVQNAHKT